MLKLNQKALVRKALIFAVLVSSVLSAPLTIAQAQAGGSADLKMKAVEIPVKVEGENVVVKGVQLRGDLLTHDLEVEARCQRDLAHNGALRSFTIDSGSGPHPGKFSKTVQLNFNKTTDFKKFKVPGIPLASRAQLLHACRGEGGDRKLEFNARIKCAANGSDYNRDNSVTIELDMNCDARRILSSRTVETYKDTCPAGFVIEGSPRAQSKISKVGDTQPQCIFVGGGAGVSSPEGR